MLPSPEQITRIQALRARATAGTLTLEDMRETIILMRQGRVSVGTSTKKTKSKAEKGPAKSADQLLSELGGL